MGGADINGADFTNALLDKTQQIVRRMHPSQASTTHFRASTCYDNEEIMLQTCTISCLGGLMRRLQGQAVHAWT